MAKEKKKRTFKDVEEDIMKMPTDRPSGLGFRVVPGVPITPEEIEHIKKLVPPEVPDLSRPGGSKTFTTEEIRRGYRKI